MQTARIENVADISKTADEELTRIFPERSLRRVLFVTPPDADESLFNYATAKRGRYWNYPAYGAGVLASHLRKNGIVVDILNLTNATLKAARLANDASELDFNRVWQEALDERIKQFKPDMLGISVMFSQSHPSAAAVARHAKKVAPKLPLAMGGVHITNALMSDNLAKALQDDFRDVDFFFTYEAEIALNAFVDVVNKKAPSSDLAQVFFNTCSEKLFFTKKLTPVLPEELDVIPALDLMNIREVSLYGTIGSFYCLREEGTRFATVLANRGCRARCTFCSVRNFNGDGVRSRSVQSVIDELKMLRDEYGIGHIMWLDDDFLNGHERALNLFNEMVRQNVGMTWDCTNGVIAASCTDELMAAAAASGCLGFNIGMESGSAKILKEIKKPGNVNTFLRAAEVLRKHEQINARVFLMIGFPGETYRMILDTINVASQMDLDWYNVSILQPLPNTPIFSSMVAQGLLTEVNFQEIRYNTGSYGKHRKLAENKNTDMLANDFKNAFSHANLDDIPPKEQLDDIWAYMNYHLNFKRLFSEERPAKLIQKFKYVRNITDLVAPDNAIAMYFDCYLEHKTRGKIDPHSIKRLEARLETDPYWKKRFDDFQLSVSDLKSCTFPASRAL